MRGKKTVRLMGRLAVFMAAPALGAATGVQAAEQTAGEPAAAEQGIYFAQAEMPAPMGSGAGPVGPHGMAPHPGMPWGRAPGGGGPVGPGMMGPEMMPGQGGPGGPMMGGRGWGMASVMQALALPNLSEEQRGELRGIAQATRKKHWDLKGAMMDESDKLAQLWAAEPVDAGAIGEAYGRLFDLQRQSIVSAIETRQQVDKVLTAEQQQWLRGGPPMPPAGMPMMAPGAMMPPQMPGAPGGAPSAAAPEGGEGGAGVEGGAPPAQQ